MIPLIVVFAIVVGLPTALAACWWSDRHPGGVVDQAMELVGLGPDLPCDEVRS